VEVASPTVGEATAVATRRREFILRGRNEWSTWSGGDDFGLNDSERCRTGEKSLFEHQQPGCRRATDAKWKEGKTRTIWMARENDLK